MTAIVSSDIVFLLSAPAASVGYTSTGTAGNSRGKFCATSVLSGTPLDNLFTDITGAENAASQVDYACLFVLNNTSSGNSMINTIAWLPSSLDVVGGATIQLATDNIGSVVKGSSSPQAAVIASTTTAPTGISSYVSTSSTNAGGLSVGTVAPGYTFAVWFKRTAHNTVPVNNDGFSLQVDFDTQG